MLLSIQTGNLVDEMGFGAYRMFREAGFEAIDWNLDHAWKFSRVSKAEELEGLCVFEKPLGEILAAYADEVAAIRDAGLVITQAHAPFAPYDVGRTDILAYATKIYQNMIPFCSAVGCGNLIVHGISYKQAEPEEVSLADINRLTMDMYRALIPALLETRQNGGTPVTVCLENLFSRYDTLGRGFRDGCCSDPHEAVYMIDTLNAEAGCDCFGLCVDTGHLNLLRKDFRWWIPVLGKRIVATHIHDNDQMNDSHLYPYAGNICWQEFLHAMRGIGYDRDLSFETYAQTVSARLPRELVPAYLRLNAQIGQYFRDFITG